MKVLDVTILTYQDDTRPDGTGRLSETSGLAYLVFN